MTRQRARLLRAGAAVREGLADRGGPWLRCPLPEPVQDWPPRWRPDDALALSEGDVVRVEDQWGSVVEMGVYTQGGVRVFFDHEERGGRFSHTLGSDLYGDWLSSDYGLLTCLEDSTEGQGRAALRRLACRVAEYALYTVGAQGQEPRLQRAFALLRRGLEGSAEHPELRSLVDRLRGHELRIPYDSPAGPPLVCLATAAAYVCAYAPQGASVHEDLYLLAGRSVRSCVEYAGIALGGYSESRGYLAQMDPRPWRVLGAVVRQEVPFSVIALNRAARVWRELSPR